MMKTPDEIKKGLECCFNERELDYACEECPYDEAGSECGDLLSDALAYIKQLEERNAWHEGNTKYLQSFMNDLSKQVTQLEAKVPKWISVEEQLPENGRMVIGYTPCDGFMFVGYYVENRNWKQWYIVTVMRSTKYMTKKVTHWMPLPEPPVEV